MRRGDCVRRSTISCFVSIKLLSFPTLGSNLELIAPTFFAGGVGKFLTQFLLLARYAPNVSEEEYNEISVRRSIY